MSKYYLAKAYYRDIYCHYTHTYTSYLVVEYYAESYNNFTSLESSATAYYFSEIQNLLLKYRNLHNNDPMVFFIINIDDDIDNVIKFIKKSLDIQVQKLSSLEVGNYNVF